LVEASVIVVREAGMTIAGQVRDEDIVGTKRRCHARAMMVRK
jgi:hypothetical protein